MDILTTKEAAAILNCGNSTIKKHARIIGIKKFGNRWMIQKEDIRKLKGSISFVHRKKK